MRLIGDVIASFPIAIDGPGAAGKTVVGRLLARQLGCPFLDTGLMYRAVTWQALQEGVPLTDAEALTRLAQEETWEVASTESGEATILVHGADVSAHLRSGAVERGVSLVAQVPEVRSALVARQRRVAENGPLVMVGRDIGTVVLPDAPLKLFLAASTPERARRRHQELLSLGQDVSDTSVLEELERRDRIDSEREVSPLRPASDARVVWTDGRTVKDVVRELMTLVEETAWHLPTT